MKEIVKTLIVAAKNDPKEFYTALLSITAVFVFMWASMWIAAILEGNV